MSEDKTVVRGVEYDIYECDGQCSKSMMCLNPKDTDSKCMCLRPKFATDIEWRDATELEYRRIPPDRTIKGVEVYQFRSKPAKTAGKQTGWKLKTGDSTTWYVITEDRGGWEAWERFCGSVNEDG